MKRINFDRVLSMALVIGGTLFLFGGLREIYVPLGNIVAGLTALAAGVGLLWLEEER